MAALGHVPATLRMSWGLRMKNETFIAATLTSPSRRISAALTDVPGSPDRYQLASMRPASSDMQHACRRETFRPSICKKRARQIPYHLARRAKPASIPGWAHLRLVSGLRVGGLWSLFNG